MYGFLFMIWFLIASIKQVYWKKLWKPFLIIGFVALFLNIGYFTRNIELFGHPLGSTQGFEGTTDPQGFKYTNDINGIPIFISNITRNLSIHLYKPYTEVTNFILDRGCTKVGLNLEDYWEYPFWMLFQNNSPTEINFVNVNVKNASRKAESTTEKTLPPCAVIYKSRTRLKPQDNPQLKFKNRTYTPALTIDPVRVYLAEKLNKSS